MTEFESYTPEQQAALLPKVRAILDKQAHAEAIDQELMAQFEARFEAVMKALGE